MASDPLPPVEAPSQVAVQPERLARLKTAATLAGEGAFAEALALLDGSPGDALGEAERSVRTLIYDFQIAVEHSALAVEEFRASKIELQQKLDTIQRQRESIQQLSAPVIDVWDGVIVVPLIGALDGASAEDLSSRVLFHLQRARTSWVILDLTGIEQIDEAIAQRLLRLAQAVGLMGARCLLTGMRAGTARLLASLGSDLATLHSVPSLREGLKHCLARGPR
jgi:rsbT co-antagonist protein RsbR